MTFWGDEEPLVFFIYLVFLQFIHLPGKGFRTLLSIHYLCACVVFDKRNDIGALKSCCSGIRLALSCLKRQLYGYVTLTISATCAGNYTTVYCAGHPL